MKITEARIRKIVKEVNASDQGFDARHQYAVGMYNAIIKYAESRGAFIHRSERSKIETYALEIADMLEWPDSESIR